MKRIILAVVSLLGQAPFSYGAEWPPIKPTSGEVEFSDPKAARFQLDVSDTAGTPVYNLSCQSGDLEDDAFNFSGLFHCRLTSLYSKETVSTLLVDNLPQTADWEGRARFLLGQVVGDCAKSPDWGAVRLFLLRRMQISLAIQDVHVAGTIERPEVISFKFLYAIRQNDNSHSPIASKAETKEPAWFSTGDECINGIFSH